MTKRILSIGQCQADHARLCAVLQKHFAVEIVPAATTAEALARLAQSAFDLVLVNRVFDRDGSLGLDFISQLKADARYAALPVMLVSNFAEAQAEAVRRGALPGFGKAALEQPETLERLRPLLGQPASQTPPPPA